MNNSRLSGAYALQECSRDLTIIKINDKQQTSKSKDATGCLAQSKLLDKSENDSEVVAPKFIRIKTAQRLTLTAPELFKKPNDNLRYGSQEYNGTDDCRVDFCTDNRQDDNDTNDSRENDGSDARHKSSCNMKEEADLFHGTHETQVSEGGEVDLHKHLLGCKKNPGHTKFIPVNNFNRTHLPTGHHDKNLVDYIKATADLTVMVDVKMVSTERPEFWPKTTIPYAFYNMRGSDVMRVGTGKVTYVNKTTEEDNNGTCPCHRCQLPENTPSKVWGEVIMYTATHVVFDDLKVRHTTCRLFYDRQDSPMVTRDGWTVRDANIEEDRCHLAYMTCELDLLDKLYKMYRNWCDLRKKVTNKYKSSRDKDKLTFIVSHPHGCPKQISVGYWIDRNEGSDGIFKKTKYTYTTCTCPGSSGAHLHSLGFGGLKYHVRHVHSGVNSEGNNFSGTGREYP